MVGLQIDIPEWFQQQQPLWLLVGAIVSVTAIYALYGCILAVYRGAFDCFASDNADFPQLLSTR